jgi:hypothetical protein
MPGGNAKGCAMQLMIGFGGDRAGEAMGDVISVHMP